MNRKHQCCSRDGTIRRGAAIVELAIVLPFLLLLVFGIIEFGQVTFVRQTLISSASQGARRAILPNANQESVVGIVQQALEDGGLGQYDVEIQYAHGEGNDLSETVTVRLPYSDVSLLGGFFGEFTLESSCTMFRGPLD